MWPNGNVKILIGLWEDKKTKAPNTYVWADFDVLKPVSQLNDSLWKHLSNKEYGWQWDREEKKERCTEYSQF